MANKSEKKNWQIYLFSMTACIVLVALDQVSKYIISTKMELYDSIPIFKNVLELHYIHNPGAAWGILENKQIIFYVCAIMAVIFGTVFYRRIVHTGGYVLVRACIVFILAGAIGNLIDRLLYQYVIDFIYVKLIDFPVFNVADCYVTVGFFVLLFLLLFRYKEEDLEAMFGKSSKKD